MPEVWFWRRGKLQIFALQAVGGGYEDTDARSRLLPGLDVALLERCAAISSWQQARSAFRAALAAGR